MELADTLDVSLECGELVQLSGGHTARTIDAMERMAAALGAQESHCAISSVNVSMSVFADGRTLTAGRRAGHLGINFSMLTAVERLVADTEELGLSPSQVRARLELIRHPGRTYPTWLVMVMLGVASAAFAALFGAGYVAAVLTLVGGWAGAWTRHLLVRRHQKPFVFVGCAAFVSAFVVAAGTQQLGLSPAEAAPALAASVLFLVPGVPLLNGTADLLTANYLNGLVRLVMSAVIIASAAGGLTIAQALVRVLP
jgi:uncharacterized membrane protein YjjP (DUF1212 family)